MENKTSRYFKYAIGEIILVVIGILIALQINNWNEAKKDRAYELKMLKELSVAIKEDLKYTENHILGYRTKTAEKGVAFFKRLLKKEEADLDSLRYYFNWITYGVSFQINEGPYQALKSVGMDKISNDSLRNSIQSFYDFSLPRNRQLITWGENDSDEEQASLKHLFFDEAKFKITDSEVRLLKPLVAGDFWLEPKFIELLKASESRLRWRRNHFEYILRDLNTLKALIDSELK